MALKNKEEKQKKQWVDVWSKFMLLPICNAHPIILTYFFPGQSKGARIELTVLSIWRNNFLLLVYKDTFTWNTVLWLF